MRGFFTRNITGTGVVALAYLAGVSAAAAQSPGFPDEWFFDGQQRPAALKALEGKPAPAIEIDSWIGNETSIASNTGKVVVVDFWATWCGPCMAAIPHNVELVSKYGGQGLVFVGVHDSNSGWDKAAGVVREKGINYPVGVDKSGGPTVKAYALQFWPTYVVIDRGGVIRAAGLLPTKVEDVVRVLLAENAPDKPLSGAAEFTADFYYGGESRPKGLRAAEGKPAPALAAAQWLGAPPSDAAYKNNVLVVTFVSPARSVSLGELDKLLPLQKELSDQGVQFVAVCDSRAAWAKMEALAKEKSLPFPVMHDQSQRRTSEDGKAVDVGVTAAAFGIEHFPATVVVDRSGRIRAAGVRADKVKAVVEKLLAETVK